MIVPNLTPFVLNIPSLQKKFNCFRRPNLKQLPHYVTSYMHHTGKKESKKEILKKEKKERLRIICFMGIRTRTLRVS